MAVWVCRGHRDQFFPCAARTNRISWKTVTFASDLGLLTDGGGAITPLTLAYETYGALNEDKSNAILLCHALTGDQYATGVHPVTGKTGWWDAMVGPGKPFDTNRYYIICSNVVGGCMGSTGPASVNPRSNKPFGLDFPIVTIRDMVCAQSMLIDYLGIDTLFASLAVQWAACRYCNGPRAIRREYFRPCRSLQRQNIPHKISRFMRLGDKRLWRIPIGAAVVTWNRA